MKPFANEKKLLPDFGRTPHLPWRVNGTGDDVVAGVFEATSIFKGPVLVEEKIDGACVGIRHTGKVPLIRNREHILRKGYLKDTPAKIQFRSVWGWYYDHKAQFEALNDLLGFDASVYGEWLYAAHTLHYTRLPSLFIAHTVYDPEHGRFVDGTRARRALQDAGFHIPRLLAESVPSVETLYPFMDLQSEWGKDKVEGVYIKVSDGEQITHRFKMVRPDFRQDDGWVTRDIVRNLLA